MKNTEKLSCTRDTERLTKDGRSSTLMRIKKEELQHTLDAILILVLEDSQRTGDIRKLELNALIFVEQLDLDYVHFKMVDGVLEVILP